MSAAHGASLPFVTAALAHAGRSEVAGDAVSGLVLVAAARAVVAVGPGERWLTHGVIGLGAADGQAGAFAVRSERQVSRHARFRLLGSCSPAIRYSHLRRGLAQRTGAGPMCWRPLEGTMRHDQRIHIRAGKPAFYLPDGKLRGRQNTSPKSVSEPAPHRAAECPPRQSTGPTRHVDRVPETRFRRRSVNITERSDNMGAGKPGFLGVPMLTD